MEPIHRDWCSGRTGTIYGTTASGGVLNKGTIFRIATEGTFTVLHSFGDLAVTHDGANPQAALVLTDDGYLYGTTQNGGSAGQGNRLQDEHGR